MEWQFKFITTEKVVFVHISNLDTNRYSQVISPEFLLELLYSIYIIYMVEVSCSSRQIADSFAAVSDELIE